MLESDISKLPSHLASSQNCRSQNCISKQRLKDSFLRNLIKLKKKTSKMI